MKKWQEMTKNEKIVYVAMLAFAALSLPLLFLDMSGKWPNNLFSIVLAIFSLYEAIVSWNVNRRMAYMELAAMAFLLIFAFV